MGARVRGGLEGLWDWDALVGAGGRAATPAPRGGRAAGIRSPARGRLPTAPGHVARSRGAQPGSTAAAAEGGGDSARRGGRRRRRRGAAAGGEARSSAEPPHGCPEVRRAGAAVPVALPCGGAQRCSGRPPSRASACPLQAGAGDWSPGLAPLPGAAGARRSAAGARREHGGRRPDRAGGGGRAARLGASPDGAWGEGGGCSCSGRRCPLLSCFRLLFQRIRKWGERGAWCACACV